jgi:predicted transcriptional regulator YheO
MYIDIYQLKQLGLNISQITRKLNISRNTVYKYLGYAAGRGAGLRRIDENKT